MEQNVQTSAGGWTPFGPLDGESRKVFEEATRHLIGVKYTALEVSKQVVAGINYRFLCDAQVVAPGAEPYRALMQVYQPLEGPPIVTRIVPLKTGSEPDEALAVGGTIPGGWSLYGPLDASARAVFEEAMHGFVGVRYAPLDVATQVVAGENYKYFCNATPVTQAPLNEGAIVQIFRPLQGKPHVTYIERV